MYLQLSDCWHPFLRSRLWIHSLSGQTEPPRGIPRGGTYCWMNQVQSRCQAQVLPMHVMIRCFTACFPVGDSEGTCND